MSAVLEPKMQPSSGNVADMSVKLAFSKKLQAVTNRIHSTSNVDEIILDVSRDICQLFEADRMTVYIMSEDGSSIISKVKTGLTTFKDIKLPISESSLAGFSAMNKRHMNIKDVYDDAELKQYSPEPHVPQGRRPAHRLSLQADADRADPGRRHRHRPDGRDPAHQQPRRAAVLGAARRGRGRAFQDARHRVPRAPADAGQHPVEIRVPGDRQRDRRGRSSSSQPRPRAARTRTSRTC